jgi:hypothetical protein
LWFCEGHEHRCNSWQGLHTSSFILKNGPFYVVSYSIVSTGFIQTGVNNPCLPCERCGIYSPYRFLLLIFVRRFYELFFPLLLIWAFDWDW